MTKVRMAALNRVLLFHCKVEERAALGEAEGEDASVGSERATWSVGGLVLCLTMKK